MTGPLGVVWLCCAAALGLTAETAHAYVFTTTDSGLPVHWARDVVSFGIARGGAGTLPAPQRGSEFGAIRSAFQTWEGVEGSRLRFEYVGRLDDAAVPDADDGLCGVRFFGAATLPAEVADAIAVTLVTFSGRTGELFDADILINERDFRFSTVPSTSTLDLRSVVLHEVGHLAGLDHTCGLAGEVQPSCFDPVLRQDPARYRRVFGAVMYPQRGVGDAPLWALTEDDAAGLAALYPSPSPLSAPRVDAIEPTSASGRARLTATGAGFEPGLSLRLALDGEPGAPRPAVVESAQPTRLVASFDLTGLAPGCYDVLAQNPEGKQGGLYGGLAVGGATCARPAAGGCSAAGPGGGLGVTLVALALWGLRRRQWRIGTSWLLRRTS